MEWTIFLIAMTAFVFWHVIVSKLIDNSTKESGFGDERLNIITKQQGIYKDAINFSYNLTLLTISMLCLVLTTSSIFVTGEINLYNQFILLFNITIVINALMVIFYDISSPLVVQLIIKKKHKMTDEQISDEILLAITEERLNDLMKDGEKQLSKEEITNLAKEVIAKIKEREELENKEKTNEFDA